MQKIKEVATVVIVVAVVEMTRCYKKKKRRPPAFFSFCFWFFFAFLTKRAYVFLLYEEGSKGTLGRELWSGTDGTDRRRDRAGADDDPRVMHFPSLSRCPRTCMYIP